MEYRPSLIGYLLTVLAMLVFGLLSMILLPFLVSLTKQSIHRCAKCLNEVKNNSYFGFANMEDKLVSLEVGKFGIVLTRRTLMYCVVVLTAMLAIYSFVLYEEGHNHAIVPITNIAWAAFVRDCGLTARNKDPRTAQVNFDSKYWGKGVEWEGWVVRVGLNDDDPLSMSGHAASVLVKMDIDDAPGVHGADLGLSFGLKSLTENESEVEAVLDGLQRGDHIMFRASLQSMGDKAHLHHLHAWSVIKIEGHKDVEAHSHAGGRYKLKTEVSEDK